MLTRIETAYLAILRVVVLVVATLALVVALLAAASALPALGRQVGFLQSAKPQGGTLSEYIEARKATVPVEPAPGLSPAETPSNAPAKVHEAATILQRYSKGDAGMTIPLWEQEIQASADSLLPEQTERFQDQTLLLAQQLDKATGKRLDAAGLKDMLKWNETQFKADAAMKETQKSQDASAALYKLYAASIAFVLFILVVFTFLFVKVERSLRVVRTIRVGETFDAE